MPDVLFLADAPTLAPSDAAAPATSEIQIAKTGRFKSRTYGKFTITQKDFSQWVRNFAAVNHSELPVDFDHAPELQGKTEAAGWIKGLSIRGEELWAKVEWTSLGADAVRDRRYRFISPSYMTNYTDDTGKSHGSALVGVALTNRPFLSMAAISLSKHAAEHLELAEELPADPPKPSDSRDVPDFTNIARELGLDPEADEVKILDAIKGRPLVRVAGALELDNEADEQKILTTIAELRERVQKAEDGQLTKPLSEIARDKGKKLLDQSEFDQLKRAADGGKHALSELAEKRFNDAWREAVREGRAAPASEEDFRSLYDSDPAKTLSTIEDLPRLVSTYARGAGGSVEDAPNGVDPERYLLDRRVRAHMRRNNVADYQTALEQVLAQDGDYS